MPWCDDCSKFWNAPELASGGACPTCGRIVTAPQRPPTVATTLVDGPGRLFDDPVDHPAEEAQPAGAIDKPKGAPWHFKLLVVGVAVYMVYRIVWLINWLPKHV